MQRCWDARRNRNGWLLPVASFQDCGLAMMLRFPRREVQHRFTFRIFGPNLIDCSVRFRKAWVCFAPEVEQRLVLLFGAALGGSIECFGYKKRERLQGLFAIRNAKTKSAQEVIRSAVCVGAAVLKSQRNLKARSLWI